MIVGVVQMECALGDIASNCSLIRSFALKAAERGCSVVVFPEMVDTGYEMATVREKASAWDDVPFKAVAHTAKEARITIICGLSERDGVNTYNSLAVFDSTGGLLGRYRKTHLVAYDPIREDLCIAQGSRLETVKIDDMIWGLMICYDLRFPEVCRSLALQGAEVVVLSSAWPFPRGTHWRTLIRARAVENELYVVAANRVGSDGGVTFCGSSSIIDPYGTILASAAEDGEDLIVAEVQKERVSAVRRKIPVFDHRRPEVYRFGRAERDK